MGMIKTLPLAHSLFLLQDMPETFRQINVFYWDRLGEKRRDFFRCKAGYATTDFCYQKL